MKNRKLITGLGVTIALLILVGYILVLNKKKNEKQIEIGSKQITSVPVNVDTVKIQNQSGDTQFTGVFEPSQQTTIIAETQGSISTLYVAEGDQVRQGKSLCYISAPANNAQLKLAKANLEKATQDLNKYEILVKSDAVSKQQYEAIKQLHDAATAAYAQAKTASGNSSVSAPFSGYITKRYIERGSTIMQGMPLFDIAALNEMKLVIKLTSKELEQIQIGQRVEITTDAFPEEIYTGSVSKKQVLADMSKRYDMVISVTNKSDKVLKSGMYGTVIFDDNKSTAISSPLVISRRALAGSILNPQVYVIKNNVVALKDIQIEPISDAFLIVKNGLSAGDIIVTSGQINLKDGTKVQIISKN